MRDQQSEGGGIAAEVVLWEQEMPNKLESPALGLISRLFLRDFIHGLGGELTHVPSLSCAANELGS